MKITNLQRWQEGRGLISLRYKSIAILLIVSFVTILSEALGLSFFYPIFQYIQADGDISILSESSKIWVAVIEATDKLDINISLGLLLSLAFVFFLGRQIFTYIKMVYATKIQASLLKNLRSKLFDSYLNASAEYHDTYSVGSLTNIMTQEANAAVLGILKPIELIVYIVMLAVYIAMLMIISFEMTMISIVVLFIASLTPQGWMRKSIEVGENVVDSNTKLSAYLVSRLKFPKMCVLVVEKCLKYMESMDKRPLIRLQISTTTYL
jgi:subfamily B ATP-binding cassette protein MsbA